MSVGLREFSLLHPLITVFSLPSNKERLQTWGLLRGVSLREGCVRDNPGEHGRDHQQHRRHQPFSHRQSTCRKTGHSPHPRQPKRNSRNIQAERAEMSRSFKASISLSIQREEIIHRISAELGSGKKNAQLTVTSSMTPLSEGSPGDRKLPPKRTWCKTCAAADWICCAVGKWPQRKVRL